MRELNDSVILVAADALYTINMKNGEERMGKKDIFEI